ncbi:hypothetical protein P0W64_00970 [Tsukamurella sp. 8F]|uniref:hypothetical protein n=1 Tax=unclassified Tsukamurella TaxID=2633480 RepID=UPI0023B89D7B|nr:MULTISPECIES: hypothetical protein [unclassified Tsukamurella]MDF0529157.1 hypothetical protein [Tsukamurella sp. 8J]MDF0585342.1 hypothetical protein [Tsukamurella sp. 8F]
MARRYPEDHPEAGWDGDGWDDGDRRWSYSPAEPGARDPRELSSEDAVDIDLVPPKLLLPKVRRALLVGLTVTFVASWIVLLVTDVRIAGAVLAAGAAPGLVGYVGLRRRRVVIDHRVLSRRVYVTRRVNLIAADAVELVARTAALSEVALRVHQGATTVRVPLALYGPGADGPRGRELTMLGMRRLAEALAGNPLREALAVSHVLMEQMRVQSVSAPVEMRPLFRAAAIARELPGRSELVLTRDEIGEIVE